MIWWLKAVAVVLAVWSVVFLAAGLLWLLWSHTPWWTPLATLIVTWFAIAVMWAREELER